MEDKFYILFCESPFQANKVDEEFEDQFASAKENGFEIALVNYEDLTSSDRTSFATKRIRHNDKLVNIIYRGWMLTPEQYSFLYNDLLSKNFKLINTVKEYQNCHYLPDSLKFIAKRTPKTIFEKFDNSNSINNLILKSKVFGQKSVIIKDYVKSEKHNWETACFVEDVSNIDKLKQSVNNLIELRGKYLNEGIVVREFVELNNLTIHSKSGMPLTEEYRLFFLNKELIDIFDYWEEGEYTHLKPDPKEFEEIAKQVESNFFSMDIARQKNGGFIIIELGDGQVAGLPDKTNRYEFYKRIKLMVTNIR
jgi:hypothetical protein